jgi:hypothetical protein
VWAKIYGKELTLFVEMNCFGQRLAKNVSASVIRDSPQLTGAEDGVIRGS